MLLEKGTNAEISEIFDAHGVSPHVNRSLSLAVKPFLEYLQFRERE